VCAAKVLKFTDGQKRIRDEEGENNALHENFKKQTVSLSSKRRRGTPMKKKLREKTESPGNNRRIVKKENDKNLFTQGPTKKRYLGARDVNHVHIKGKTWRGGEKGGGTGGGS